LKKNWQNALDEQKASFFERFQKQAARLIFDTVQKTLSLLADTDAQDKAVKHFLTHLKTLEQDKLPQQQTLETPPRVTSGFKLSNDQQESIQQTLFQKLAKVQGQPQETQQDTPRDTPQKVQQVEFEVKPELIFGIALFAGDKKISWHAKDYIETLEKKLNQAIEAGENE
jgi:F-type H+-transporting ATPase subunit b